MTHLTFKALSAFLLYPTQEQQSAILELLELLKQENLLDEERLGKLETLTSYLCEGDLYDLQSYYVEFFDRGRSYCLHLFEHVHGESRDRGQAMVDLATLYEEKGMQIKSNELPDYLPAFLEYLSLLPLKEAQDFLGETIDIIATIAERMKGIHSPYAAVFESLVFLSSKKPDATVIAKAALQKENRSFEALDREWAEDPAFGKGAEEGATDCGSCSIAENQS